MLVWQTSCQHYTPSNLTKGKIARLSHRGDIEQIDGRERLGRIVVENVNVVVLQLVADHVEPGEVSAQAEHGLRIAAWRNESKQIYGIQQQQSN